MSNVQQFFGSGSGATGLYQFHASTFSGTFTARIRTKYLITAIGAGGGGGKYGGGGGGAGGLAQSLITLEVGDVLTYICGAGAFDSNGGNTTISLNGSGILTANGGIMGGLGAGLNPGLGGTGGSGGTGAGGNVMNINGGRGSNGYMASQGYLAGGGGGAVGVYGKVCDAQNAGAGCGAGTSGNPQLTCFMNAMELSGSDITEGGLYRYNFGQLTPTITGVVPIFSNRILQPTGYTSTGSQSGAGVGGQQSYKTYSDVYGQHGGMFAGGGGGSFQINYNGGAGSGGAFGGGGGGQGSFPNQNNTAGGNGGNGGIIIEWMAYTL